MPNLLAIKQTSQRRIAAKNKIDPKTISRLLIEGNAFDEKLIRSVKITPNEGINNPKRIKERTLSSTIWAKKEGEWSNPERLLRPKH